MRSELALPGCSVAVTSLELQAFHCSPPAFHAFTAGPLSVNATPSPLCLGSPTGGVGRPAASTMLSPTSYTASPNHFVSCRAATVIRYHSNSLITWSILLSSKCPVSVHCLAVSTAPLQSSRDLTFHEPRNHADLLCFALCADFVFTWECCKFSAGGHSREDPGDAIGRRPVPEFIVILGRINAIAPLAGR